MENQPKKKWYQQKKVFIPALIVAGMIMGNSLHGSPANSATISTSQEKSVQGVQDKVQAPNTETVLPTKLPTATPIPTQAPTATTVPTRVILPTRLPTHIPTSVPVQQQTSNLDNNNYYPNSSGNEVHSPANTTDGSVPAGATAQCGDGTYSFSQHHSGTCSHHGGVSQWL